MMAVTDTERTRTLLRVLGDELRQARKRHGWTRRDLRAKLATEVSLQTLATYELGTRHCTVARLLELVDALDVSVLDVLSRTLQRIHDTTRADGWAVDLMAATWVTRTELAPLRRWAQCRLRTTPHGQPTVIRLDLPAVECLAAVCGIDPVALIRQLHAERAVLSQNPRDPRAWRQPRPCAERTCPMTSEPEVNPTVFWGRGVLDPKCAHVREIRDGRPVAEEVDGEKVGFAICGCLLIADIDPDAEGVTRCSVCADLLAEREGGHPPADH